MANVQAKIGYGGSPDTARPAAPGGLLITCADDPGARRLAAAAAALPVRVLSYGTAAEADYQVTELRPAGLTIRNI